VDESATGSVNFLVRPLWSTASLEHGIFGAQSKNAEFVLLSEKYSQIACFSFWYPLRTDWVPSKFPLAPSTERE
jgi:hypothetical protein